MAARLIAAGAKIDALNRDGDSALLFACDSSHVKTAALLIEAGATLNIIGPSGESACDWADKRGLVAISALIRARGGRPAAEII